MGRVLRTTSVAALLVLGLAIQTHFLTSYPQPRLFGDPGAYHRVGLLLREAVHDVARGEPAGEVLDRVRPYLYLTGVGSIYAGVESVRGVVRRAVGFEARTYRSLRPLPFFRLAFAVINVVGMLGVFLLARELTRSFAGGLVALAMAVLYPSFSLQIGRLFPEWVYATVFIYSAWAYAVAVRTRSYAWMAAAGLLLGGGFFLRAQLMNYFPLLLGAGLVAAAPWWARARQTRRLAAVLVLSSLPAIVAWNAIVRAAGGDFSKIESFGFYMFPEQQLYPYGFWMLLEADGWMGAYQLREDPFYLALEEAAQDDPELLRSRARQYAFTARYVADRLGESVLVVLDNIYRTYDRPANNFQWDYPYSTGMQSAVQKAIVVLAVVGMAAFAMDSLPLAGVFFVPLCLAALFGLGTPQPRYGQPSMLIVLAVAGALVAAVAGRRRELLGARRQHLRALAAVVGVAVLAALLGTLLWSAAPALGRFLRGLATLSFLAVPFLVAWLVFGATKRQTLGLGVAWTALAIVVTAHMVQDPGWHERAIPLNGGAVVQQIALPPQARAELRGASEAYVMLDLHSEEGELSEVRVDVNGIPFEGSRLISSMPRFGESTTVGGKDPRTYRQWWALPLPREALDEPMLRIRVEGAGGTLYSDRFPGQEEIYEGPSFGDVHRVSAPKLEYDGDHRLPVTLPLKSADTTSYRLDEVVPYVLRIRVVTLASNEGSYRWQSPVLPAGAPTALVFRGYSSGGGDAEILVDGEAIAAFPLGSERDYEVARLCHRTLGLRGDNAYGAYVLELPTDERERSRELTVRFRSKLSNQAKFFSVDATPLEEAELNEIAESCDVSIGVAKANGLERVLDASRNSYPRDTGRWRVRDVY